MNITKVKRISERDMKRIMNILANYVQPCNEAEAPELRDKITREAALYAFISQVLFEYPAYIHKVVPAIFNAQQAIGTYLKGIKFFDESCDLESDLEAVILYLANSAHLVRKEMSIPEGSVIH